MKSAVLTCLDMSCFGDTLANSAQRIELDDMSGGERWQCRTAVFVTYWRHSCIRNVRNTLQGGSFPGTEQVARRLMLRPKGGTGAGGDGWRQTDGHQSQSDGLGGGQRGEKGLSQQKCVSHCSEDKFRKDFFDCESYHFVSSQFDFQNLVNPVSWFAKSSFGLQNCFLNSGCAF